MDYCRTLERGALQCARAETSRPEGRPPAAALDE